MYLYRCVLFVVVPLLTMTGPARASATVEGTVALPGSKRSPVMIKRYEIVSRSGVIAPSPAVAVVYLDGIVQLTAPSAVKQVIQKDFMFVPALLPVQAGTKVEFPNLDKGYHNVFSYSDTKRFDLGRYRPDERPVPFQIFDKAGLVTLRCEIHDHMRALILVLNSPHFVTTETDGHFKLSCLPAGRFILKSWLNSKTTLEKPVSLKVGSTLHVDFP